MRALIFISTLCVAITTNFLRSQERFDPIVSVGYSPRLEFEAMGGVYLNNKLDLRLFLRSLTLKDYVYSNEDLHNLYPLGIQANYRFLDYWISPSVALGAGTVVYSDARGKFVSDYLGIVDKVKNQVYNYGTFTGTAKLLLDCRIKQFRLQIGGDFNYYLINVIKTKSYTNSYAVDDMGYLHLIDFYGLDANLIYTINRKKNEK